MSVITVTVPPPAARRRRMRGHRSSGVWSPKLLPDGLRRPVRPLGRPHPWAVITVDSQISQKVWVETAGLKQLPRCPVHVFEEFVADDDIEILVRVDERTRHVVSLRSCGSLRLRGKTQS